VACQGAKLLPGSHVHEFHRVALLNSQVLRFIRKERTSPK
jgi:hypothetical protein